MITGLILNMLTGSGLKMAAHTLGTVLSSRSRQKEIERASLHNMSIEKLKVMYGGDDRADGYTKHTRRLIAFTLVGVFCTIVAFHAIIEPELALRILIPSEPGLLEGIFSSTENQETVNVSASSLLWRYFELMEIVIGFYFTKIPSR